MSEPKTTIVEYQVRLPKDGVTMPTIHVFTDLRAARMHLAEYLYECALVGKSHREADLYAVVRHTYADDAAAPSESDPR